MTRDEEVIIMECEEIMAERREHREWIQGLIADAEAAKPAPCKPLAKVAPKVPARPTAVDSEWRGYVDNNGENWGVALVAMNW